MEISLLAQQPFYKTELSTDWLKYFNDLISVEYQSANRNKNEATEPEGLNNNDLYRYCSNHHFQLSVVNNRLNSEAEEHRI